MSILFLGSHVLDLDQIATATEHPRFLELLFKNGDKVDLPWRDEFERRDILKSFPATLSFSKTS